LASGYDSQGRAYLTKRKLKDPAQTNALTQTLVERWWLYEATHPNHVWGYDFVQIRDAYGGKIRMLNLIDEFSRKFLTIFCARGIGSVQVIEQLANAMIIHGIPKYIRGDNSPEFIAKELRSWLSGIGVKSA
jgi:putative transposase